MLTASMKYLQTNTSIGIGLSHCVQWPGQVDTGN